MPDRANTIAFLGGGRITSALAAGLRLAGDKREIVVYDRHPEKLRMLRRASRIEVARDLKSALARASMMIVAVRPGAVAGILEEIAESGAGLPRICISLAAGIPLAKLTQSPVRAYDAQPRTKASGTPRHRAGAPAPLGAARWVRAMPSPVCRVGRGLTALCFGRGVSKSERARVRGLFKVVGTVVEIPESQFDEFTATYSSSHGYHALAALARAAERAGLERATALTAAAHALGDGIRYWRESGKALADLLHEAATPGGIAATTMLAMDKSGYGRAVERGLRAGIQQARRNARA